MAFVKSNSVFESALLAHYQSGQTEKTEDPMHKILTICMIALAISGCARFGPPGDAPEETVRPISRALAPAPAPGSYSAAERDCMADAIYHEAKNTGPVGLQAVGHVVMNRVASREFPNSVCGVVRQGEARGRCQFSYRCDGIAETYPDRPAHRRALALATRFLTRPPQDITRGALFFHADWARPNAFFKSRRTVGKFGGNIFYL